MDLDPFDAPIDARIYISYRNIAERPISAVKFRIRLTDDTGKDRGTFHAPDATSVGPGQERQQKWRRDRIDPLTTSMKVRVLQVRYIDGSTWDSVKMQELAQPSDAPSQP